MDDESNIRKELFCVLSSMSRIGYPFEKKCPVSATAKWFREVSQILSALEIDICSRIIFSSSRTKSNMNLIFPSASYVSPPPCHENRARVLSDATQQKLSLYPTSNRQPGSITYTLKYSWRTLFDGGKLVHILLVFFLTKFHIYIYIVCIYRGAESIAHIYIY